MTCNRNDAACTCLCVAETCNCNRPRYANWRYQEVLAPIFNEFSVDLVLAGDDHIYYRTHPIVDRVVRDSWQGKRDFGGEDVYHSPRGTIYVVTGGGGQLIESFLSIPTPYTTEIWADFNSVEITLNADRLVLRGVAPNGAPEGLEVDRFTIDKSPRPEFAFIRGDASFDGRIDISDAIRVLEHIFLGRDAHCVLALDWDNNDAPEVNDAILCLEYLFISGTLAPAPFPDCGTDPTGEDDDAFCHQTGCF